MSIAANIDKITSALPEGVKLVAVSKFHPVEAIEEAYAAGQRVFGESRVQELDAKQPFLPEDIEWHFIGHLQTNKVKYIVPYIHTIESVDSWKLLKEIDKYASSAGRVINCLLEVYIAQEDTKYGLAFDECRALLQENDWKDLESVKITGVMGMASNIEDEKQIKKEFRSLKLFFEELKASYFKDFDYFREISIGMSHDYKLAIQEGSSIVRIGSAIFGDRN